MILLTIFIVLLLAPIFYVLFRIFKEADERAEKIFQELEKRKRFYVQD